MKYLRHPAHLVVRFFDVLTARRLRPREQAEAAALLAPGERSMFWAQSPADQRHGLECARRVLRARPGRVTLARAALLHDVGKRHAGLGPIGRSIAAVAGMLRLPRTARMDRYLDHAELGARDLAAAGAAPGLVAYVRHHHGARPDAIAAADWQLLQAADRGRVLRR